MDRSQITTHTMRATAEARKHPRSRVYIDGNRAVSVIAFPVKRSNPWLHRWYLNGNPAKFEDVRRFLAG